MAVTQYIGARYVPIFADPSEWDHTKTYEPLTIVLHEGNSFTSKQSVPVGVDINNTQYWAETGNYSAQVEAYRREVREFDGRITANAEDIEQLQEDLASEALTRSTNDTTLDNKITAAKTELEGDIADAKRELESDIATKEDIKNYIAVIGDSFSTSNTYDYWPQIIANRTKWNVINKAVNGAGFIGGSKTFIQQLNELKADANFSKVAHIIVYGGVNDWNNSHASVATMNDAISQFYAAYYDIPKASRPEIHFCFGNIGFANLPQYNGFYEWYKAVKQLCEMDGRPGIVDNVVYWHFNFANAFNADNLHPNASGQKIIASYMMQILDRTYTGVHRSQWFNSLTYNNTAANGRTVITFDNGQVNFGLRMASGFPLTPQTNTFYDFGDVTGSQPQFSLMVGTDTGEYPNIWQISEPILIANTENETGQFRAIFNCSNKHMYFQLHGSAAGFSTLEVPADLQINMHSVPCSW